MSAAMFDLVDQVVARIDDALDGSPSVNRPIRDALIEARATLAVVAAALTPAPDPLSPLDRIREVLIDHEDDATLLDALRDLVGTADRQTHPTGFLPVPTPSVWDDPTPTPPPGAPTGAVIDDAGVVTVHHPGDDEPTEVLRPLPLEPEPVDDPGTGQLMTEIEAPADGTVTELPPPHIDDPCAGVWTVAVLRAGFPPDVERCQVWIGDEQCVNRADECRPGHHRLRPPDRAVLAQADDPDLDLDLGAVSDVDRIVELLTEHGPLNNGDLADRLGRPRTMVQPLIDYLRASGRVRRLKPHRWELVDPGERS